MKSLQSPSERFQIALISIAAASPESHTILRHLLKWFACFSRAALASVLGGSREMRHGRREKEAMLRHVEPRRHLGAARILPVLDFPVNPHHPLPCRPPGPLRPQIPARSFQRRSRVLFSGFRWPLSHPLTIPNVPWAITSYCTSCSLRFRPSLSLALLTVLPAGSGGKFHTLDLISPRRSTHPDKLPHQGAGCPRRIYPTGPAYPVILRNVHAPLAELQSADQAMLPPQLPGQLPLGQTGLMPHLHQGLSQTLALLRVDRLVHARMLRAECRCFQNAGRRILAASRTARNSRGQELTSAASSAVIGSVLRIYAASRNGRATRANAGADGKLLSHIHAT